MARSLPCLVAAGQFLLKNRFAHTLSLLAKSDRDRSALPVRADSGGVGSFHTCVKGKSDVAETRARLGITDIRGK